MLPDALFPDAFSLWEGILDVQNGKSKTDVNKPNDQANDGNRRGGTDHPDLVS